MSEIRTDTINNASGDNDSGIDLSTNDQVGIKTADTTRVTVDSSGNLLVGKSSSSGATAGAELRPAGDNIFTRNAGQALILRRNNNDGDFLQLNKDGTTVGQIGVAASDNLYIAGATGSTKGLYFNDAGIIPATTGGGTSDNAVDLGQSNVRYKDIYISSVLYAGKTSYALDNNTGTAIDDSGQILLESSNGVLLRLNRKDGNGHGLQFYRGSTNIVGSITFNTSSVAYNTSSDHRLKENVTADWDATTRLKQLNPVRFNFIADADTTVDGFLAHEVQSVVPEAISGTHNEVEVWKDGEELPDGVSVGDNKLDEDGNTIPVYQGIDQSKLVPLLVKTIQELEARITALESE